VLENSQDYLGWEGQQIVGCRRWWLLRVTGIFDVDGVKRADGSTPAPGNFAHANHGRV
jgi:hypothetical protein